MFVKPRLSSRARLLASAGVLSGLALVGYAASASTALPSASLSGDPSFLLRQGAASPMGGFANVNSRLPQNLASILQYPSGMQPSGSGPIWDGQGDLPGAFQAPWSLAETNFDPSFRTSYWSESTGFLNNATAPWSQGIASRFNKEIFGYGMAYLGTQDYSGLAPVWAPPASMQSAAAL